MQIVFYGAKNQNNQHVLIPFLYVGLNVTRFIKSNGNDIVCSYLSLGKIPEEFFLEQIENSLVYGKKLYVNCIELYMYCLGFLNSLRIIYSNNKYNVKFNITRVFLGLL